MAAQTEQTQTHRQTTTGRFLFFKFDGGANRMSFKVSKDESLAKRFQNVGLELENLFTNAEARRLTTPEIREHYEHVMVWLQRMSRDGAYFINVEEGSE